MTPGYFIPADVILRVKPTDAEIFCVTIHLHSRSFGQIAYPGGIVAAILVHNPVDRIFHKALVCLIDYFCQATLDFHFHDPLLSYIRACFL